MPLKRTKGQFKITQNKKKFEKFKVEAPLILANYVLNYFLQGFRQGGKQTDASAGGWKPRKREDKRQGRAILVDRGHLRDSIQKKVVTFGNITIGTSRIPYARRHNEGLAGMPQREFLGKSSKLNKRVAGKLWRMVDKVMK